MKIGIVCDLSYTRSLVISNYYHTIKNLYGDVIIVKEAKDLVGLDMVFIGNDHFAAHREIWTSSWFVFMCNKLKIKVIFLSCEKIVNSCYSSDVDHIQKTIASINDSKQYVWDADDSVLLDKKLIGFSISKYYKNKITIPQEKQNKCVFVGQYHAPEYEDRRKILQEINKVIETDIITNFQGSWKEYLEIFAKYRYVLSPLSGISNSFPCRFYEALLVKSIPIHQVRSMDTLKYYSTEAGLHDCVYFTTAEDLKPKLSSFTETTSSSIDKLWFEDKLRNLLNEDGIFVPNTIEIGV